MCECVLRWGSGVVDDSIYTNAAASQTMSWCLEAADILGIDASSLPPLWAEMAASPFLQMNDTECEDGPVHQEYTGYKYPRTINQAGVFGGPCAAVVWLSGAMRLRPAGLASISRAGPHFPLSPCPPAPPPTHACYGTRCRTAAVPLGAHI
jgi:hypothetical protein